jgi:hypothetical protein
MFKVRRNPDGCLCATCRHGQVVERRNGARFSFCHVAGDRQQMPMDVVKCSDYEDRRATSEYDMEKVAWRITHRRDGTIQGFAPPKKGEKD